MDNASVHKLVGRAVQACPMDTRREMWRSVYLSGGTTQIPGFIDRLQLELQKFVPSSIVVEVHASPHRYHAAYIGACTLASLDVFEQSCISSAQWKREGPPSLRKWHMY
ncbi:putative actin-9 [Lamellibrachia satsuma]|nr:putative actin-9 [Lamellibrachia satsuma]